MNLPGLITVQPDRTEELDALARMVGTCFLEEMWYVTWLEALDELGIGRDRKLEITRAESSMVSWPPSWMVPGA